MFTYALRRILLLVPVLLAVLFITFALGFYGPGDPLTIFFGEDNRIPEPEIVERLRKIHGLDRPFFIQFGDYILGLTRGDFGNSLRNGYPIIKIMKSAMPISAQLGVAASVVLVLIGIPLGILAAVKQNTWVDYLIITLSISVRSVPVFVLAPMMLIVLVLWLDIIKTPVGWSGLFNQKAIIPVFLLAGAPLLGVIRMTRTGVLEAMGQSYVRTARAKGLHERLVVGRHMVRNSITPVLTTVGLTVSGLITGAIFVELIFGIPGFAGVGIAAFQTRDYPMILGTTIVGATILVVANLLVDIGYGMVDPRVRYA